MTFLLIGEEGILGYFTLANKVIKISKYNLSKTLQKKLERFSSQESEDSLLIPLILIAQLGKNSNLSSQTCISGEKIMNIIFDKILEVQDIIGGKAVFLECVNHSKVIQFYEKNGFKKFGERNTFHQMIKIM